MKRNLSLAVIVAAALAAGCKDGMGPDPEPGPGTPGGNERGASVTATITAAGGTLRAVTEDGAVVTLDFPAGAVDQALQLTLSPRPAGAGAWARLELSPSGVRLERPVEIRLTAPEGRTIDGSAFRLGAPGGAVLLPTGRHAASRTLSTRTQLLGYGAGLATGGASSRAPGGASMAVAAAGGPSFSLDPEGPGSLYVGEVTCAQALASLEARVEHARKHSFASAEAAHALLSEIEAVTLLCGEDPGGEAALAESLAELKVSACQGYDEARTNATVLFIDDAEMLHALLVPVLGWEATKQLVGTDCGLPANDFLELIAAKYDQFLDGYTERIQGPDFGDGIYRAMWGEIVNVYDIAADTQLLGLAAAEAKIYEIVLPAVLDRLREEGYGACRDDEVQFYLADVLSGGHVFDHALVPSPMAHARFSAEELARDIQYCASKLTVKSFDGVEPLDSRELHGGAEPGAHVSEAALTVPLDEGVLVLQGDVHAFTCLLPGQPVTLGSDELVIRVDGEEVRRLQHGGGRFLTSALELDVEGILWDAGLDPETVEEFALTVSREGPACEGHFGEPSFTLFTVAVEVGESRIRGVQVQGRAQLAASLQGVTAAYDGVGSGQVQDVRELEPIGDSRDFYIRYVGSDAGTSADQASTGTHGHSHTSYHGLGMSISGSANSSTTLSVDRSGGSTTIGFSGTASGTATATITGTDAVPAGAPVLATASLTPGSWMGIQLSIEIPEPMDYSFSVGGSGFVFDGHIAPGSGRLEPGGYSVEVYVLSHPPGKIGPRHAYAVWREHELESQPNKLSDSFSADSSAQFTLTLTPAAP